MKHKEQPILEVLVETDPAGTVELDSEIGHVKMIPFKGSVKSPIFTGIVEPCGVDTQVTNQNEVRHMSARYMLTGKDKEGAEIAAPITQQSSREADSARDTSRV